MKLRSDNVGSKTPKHSSFPITNEIKQNEEEDKISILPDEILTHILSLLPDADAHRCRILSNRWNHLFFFLPFLCFKMPPSYKYPVEVINKFYDFVDKTFSIRNRDMPVIKRFFLSIPYYYDHNRVLGWILIVLPSQHLQTFSIRNRDMPVIKRFSLSCSHGYDPKRVLRWLHIVLHSKLLHTLNLESFSLSWDLLMTCTNTLIDLTLKNVNMVGLDETRLLFPCLKRVKLEYIKYSADQSPQSLISACPVLQELFLDKQKLHSQLRTFKISSPSLKRLRIQWCEFGYREVVIDAPKLEYFYIRDYSSSTYSLTNPSSLVEAYTDINTPSDIQLTNISFAGILTLGTYCLWGLSKNPGLIMPVFPNLIKLSVDFEDIRAWDMLFILLKNMPNLQHITIDFGYHSLPFKRSWNSPMAAPACLCFMLKEIVILNGYAVYVEDHITLIRYLLSHSSVLEKLTLSTFDIDHERHEKLLKIYRRSKSCQIEFV